MAMQEEISIVFMEFTPVRDPGKGKDYFVGKNVEKILAITNGGKSFGGINYESRRIVQIADAGKLKGQFREPETFKMAVEAVTNGDVTATYIGYIGTRWMAPTKADLEFAARK